MWRWQIDKKLETSESRSVSEHKAFQRANRLIKEAELSNAISLNLSCLGLTVLPESIERLTYLRYLILSINQLTTLPVFLTKLTYLQHLDLSVNQLTALPEFLGSMTNLRHLDLSDNQLRKPHEFLGKLKHLDYIDLSYNQLSNVPEFLAQLTSLRNLDISANRLTSLPEFLATLTQLEGLDVSENRITELPESLGNLRLLKNLFASHNKLTALPDSLRKLKALVDLQLSGNDGIGMPPEVLAPKSEKRVRSGYPPVPDTSVSTILNYYFRTRRGRRPLNEAKLILVGRGGVGKTCLVNRLLRDTFQDQLETAGIKIEPWEIELPCGESARLHVWDFGGQRILHGTHQFFLTERTLYLLVLSAREDNATQDAEYWLQLIKSFGADSRVIIALNKHSQHAFDVNRGFLMEKYPFIADFVKTDCEDRVGLSALRELILRETEAMEHRKTDFPEDWFRIKEQLARNPENYLEWERYQQICHESGEKDPRAQKELAFFLHILGIALNYADDPRLKDTRVLKPTWVTEGIYTLLRACQKKQSGGVLASSDLNEALDSRNYPATKHDFLLGLMEKFQLCFPIPTAEKQYLVPELLGENQPPEIPTLLATSGLGFRYQYEVLPESLLPRFIVQTSVHSEICPHLRWRTGVVLEREECCAVIRADTQEHRVDIHITGAERPRRDLLAIIREKFDEQHRDLKGVTVEERVPIPGERGVTVSHEHLLTLEDEHEEWCRPEGSKKRYLVADLLNGVELRESRQRRRELGQELQSQPNANMKKRHIFLSYSHDNDIEVTRLHDELVAAGKIVWWDKEIKGGQDWKFEIRQAMKSAYAVVLCLSQETAARARSGIYPELLDAINAYREYGPGSVFLIPIRLSDCEIPPIEIDSTRTLDRLQYVDFYPSTRWDFACKKLIEAIQAAPDHP